MARHDRARVELGHLSVPETTGTGVFKSQGSAFQSVQLTLRTSNINFLVNFSAEKKRMVDLEQGSSPARKVLKLSLTPIFKLNPLEWISAALGFASALALFIYLAFFYLPGPTQIIGTGIGIWLCAFNVYFTLLVFHQSRKPFQDVVDWFWAQLFFFVYTAVTSFIVAICYAINNRPEGYVWAIILFILSSFNIALLFFRMRASGENWKPQLRSGEKVGPWCCSPGRATGCCTCLKIWIFINYGFLLVFMALLVNGALIEGQAAVFKPRGQFYTVTLADGSKQKIHYLCEGPRESTSPVLMFDADGSHGMSDFWGMQRVLADSGRRVCVFDKPGLGWSDYYYVSQNLNYSTFYHQFMTGIGEKTPYIFVAWGGGAENVWPYANEHPEMVSAIVYMDAYSSGIEWRELQNKNNWTDDQARARRSLDITGRSNLFHVIRGLGTPWGLNTIFVPYNPAGYEPADRYNEYRWYYLTDKTWTTQFYYLLNIAKEPLGKDIRGSFDRRNPGLNVPIHHLMTFLNDTVVCQNAKANPGSPECLDAIRTNDFMKQDQFFITNVTGRATFSYCSDPSCSQNFPIVKSRWAAEEIIRRFPL